MRISVVQSAPIFKCILLYIFMWSPKDGRAHLRGEGGCRRTLGLRLQRACELDASNDLMGHGAIYHLPIPTTSPSCLNVAFTPLILSPLMLPVSVTQLRSCVFSTSPTVHVSLFGVHLFLLMN